MRVGITLHSLKSTGGVRVVLDFAKKLVDGGNEVSLLVCTCTEIFFDIPKGVVVYLYDGTRLESYPRSSSVINERSHRSVFGDSVKKVKSILLGVVVYNKALYKSVFYVRYLLFKVRHKVYYKSVLADLRSLNLDLVVSTSIYNRLEINFQLKNICPVIFYVHNDLQDVFTRDNFFFTGSIKDVFRGSSVVFISKEQMDRGKIYLDESSSPIVIYNPIDFDRIRSMAEDFASLYSSDVVYVGSLTSRKRVDRIIRAVSFLSNTVSLIVIGDGPERMKLEQLAFDLGVSEQVIFLGRTSNPYPIIKKSSVLVLSSDAEGLPTVLIEALVLNVPIVSTACPTGAREIVSVFDEKYLVDLEVGTLEEDIANHIASILEKKPVVNCDIERFSSFSAMKKWNQLLQDTLKVSCL